MSAKGKTSGTAKPKPRTRARPNPPPLSRQQRDGTWKMGRPVQYDPAFVEQAKRLCSSFGATTADLATFFGVKPFTITRWRHQYPDFSAALNIEKEVADGAVARRLYERAMGYSFEAEKIFMPSGSKKPVRVSYIEHVVPDTTAQIFWLKNRAPDQWRDRFAHGNDPDNPLVDQGSTEARTRVLTLMGDILEERLRRATVGHPKVINAVPKQVAGPPGALANGAKKGNGHG